MEIDSEFRTYLEEAIGAENADVAFSAFSSSPSTSVRYNPGKVPEEDATGFFSEGTEVTTVPWSRCGRVLSNRPSFTLDPLFHCGAYYVQDSSSMFVGTVFRHILDSCFKDRPKLKVLDLCAAPGGKTTDLAASLRQFCGDGFILVANEVMKQRVQVLADNVALWGDPNVVVTNNDPSDFKPLAGWFDIIVTDVPCSGEGMFRKDEEACRQWSADNVKLCAARQKRILADVWPALAEGGVLVYSTCTFNRMENDLNVEWIAEELGAEMMFPDDFPSYDGVLGTAHGFSLVPGLVPGEGQYCSALVKKTSGVSDSIAVAGKPVVEHSCRGRRKPSRGRPSQVGPAVPAVPEGLLKFKVPVCWRMRGELVKGIPSSVAAETDFLENNLRVLQSGFAVGMVKGKNLVPSADLALTMALADEAFPRVELSREDALKFLHKDSLTLTGEPVGLLIVTYKGIPLGFLKNIGNRTNNLHPQSRRIRMDLK